MNTLRTHPRTQAEAKDPRASTRQNKPTASTVHLRGRGKLLPSTPGEEWGVGGGETQPLGQDREPRHRPSPLSVLPERRKGGSASGEAGRPCRKGKDAHRPPADSPRPRDHVPVTRGPTRSRRRRGHAGDPARGCDCAATAPTTDGAQKGKSHSTGPWDRREGNGSLARHPLPVTTHRPATRPSGLRRQLRPR